MGCLGARSSAAFCILAASVNTNLRELAGLPAPDRCTILPAFNDAFYSFGSFSNQLTVGSVPKSVGYNMDFT